MHKDKASDEVVMAYQGSVVWKRRLAACICLASVFQVSAGLAGELAADPPAAPAGEFRYSDDWKIVSAPPPPGPYETVNVDPRVPGQDVARPLPREPLAIEPAARMPAEPEQMPPPAAGRPAVSAASPARRSTRPYTPPPSGAYSRQGYGRSPATRYNAPGYPGYQGQQAYPGYGSGQGYRPGYEQGYGQSYEQGYGQGYRQGQGYGSPYPGQYAPSRQQDIPPPPYATVPDR